ncbi:MAG TPA: bifunctional glutamate N-acetyltransferase/amino-acid acetyltransferase ArgJ [Candidatus Omnitrophota bacterium]|nr:bifunctional glutamate N-acetyltransferase/amino-acid acetyltransferase ArgJ [Candidatus Omnitrophota bacterium]HPS36440.1 bifunctional glutamate N-acetyltransferase/amino-acid acetyltransferase ArgJ [Candidatus Omnitrophota bacterium]
MKKPFWKREKNGSVTTPRGFVAGGIHAGIKKKKKKYDVSMIYSKTPCVAAGTFTTNRAKAWPVIQSMKAMHAPKHHAILGTSGNANCLNGPIGKKAVDELTWEAAKHLEVLPNEVLISQTGIIGVPFPITCVKRAMPKLVSKLSEKGGHGAAKGILTTDLSTKEIALSIELGGKKVTIAACAKGAGMVHPNMATMLCFITTDCAITKQMLRRAVRHAADDTFNQMAIDNDMSTNDTVLCLANGEAGNPTIQKIGKDYWMFRETLEEVMRYIAHEMIMDGEGVTHVCRLRVSGAKTPTDAERAARQIANSMLFKTMLAGSNPNWGRIAAAVGASGVDFNFKDMSISFGDAQVVHQGRLRVLNIPKARRILQKKEFTIDVVIGKGRGRAEFITSDLTTKYVLINAAYS